jgi:hypothetical protein
MAPAKDLVVLTADKNAEFAVRALLSTRAAALGIRVPSFDIYVHPERDPGCAFKAHEFLRVFVASHAHALLLFDMAGCGREHLTVAALEADVVRSLDDCGWAGRARVVVIAPELEVWVWSDSPHVADALAWKDGSAALTKRLQDDGLWEAGTPKPADPKAAVEHVLRLVRKPRSSALYEELATKVGLDRCSDEAFARGYAPCCGSGSRYDPVAFSPTDSETAAGTTRRHAVRLHRGRGRAHG